MLRKTNISVFIIVAMLAGAFFPIPPVSAGAAPENWQKEWPKTDFSKTSIDFAEIISGGPPKDGIPAIDEPKFKLVSEITNIGDKEPVIALHINDKAKAYPLRVLMWHEIANDTIGDVPVTVTYCPLCNASIVFDRRVNGKTLDFGVSGKLRHSDMIMYDRQTESWWQQFTGTGIVGEMTGVKLKKIPSHIIPFAKFKTAHPNGQVLIPNNSFIRQYGANPYAGYDDSQNWPFLFKGDYDGPVPPLAYVISVENNAWPLADLRAKKRIKHDDLIITWQSGMNSALDKSDIQKGRDIGYVTVQQKLADGRHKDVIYDMTFAFVFKAFMPDGIIHTLK